MSNLHRIVSLSLSEYQTLVTQGSLTKGGRTITYDENDFYVVPDEGVTLSHTLTFGSGQQYTFDGSQDVTVPVYTGVYI